MSTAAAAPTARISCGALSAAVGARSAGDADLVDSPSIRAPTIGPQSVRQIAQDAGFSPYHFIRLFRGVFGETPHQCQITARLAEAKNLLAVTDESITDIQEPLFKQGIPLTAFEVDDIKAEYERLKAKGVVFTMEPTATGPVTIAILADTCGNLLQLYQPADV